MKPKHIISTFFFLIGLLVSSCSDDTEKPYIPEPPVGDGYSLLRLSIGNNQQTPTYAPGTFDAYPQEKEIRSVAFFTKTDDVGQYGQPGFKAGAFNRFLSTEDLRSAYGLYEPLEQAGTGYTASIRIKSEGFGPKTQLIVIANYEENGLTDILKTVATWDDLTTVLTPRITGEHLKTPLLMYGSNAHIALTNGGTEAVTINLYRVVARLDVVNDAADDNNPDNGFVLESAQLLHPKEFGFLLPGNKQSILIPTVASLPIVKAGNLPESDAKKITGLYLYETDNKGEESEKTRVVVKGQLFGTPFEREIALKKPDEPGKDGDPIAMNRNHRYQLTITNVVGEDIDWNVQIVDWSTGQDIDVKPALEKPLITNVTFDNGGEASRWDEATHTYTYDGKNPEVIRFTATTSTHATTYAFECELDGKGESIGLNNPMLPAYRNLFKQNKPVMTYASISQEYEITLPTVLEPDVYAVPVDIKLYIRNTSNKYYADTITVRCRPDYLGMAGIQPVKVGGIYWAPLNVGATSLTVTGKNLESHGYCYQWGRNVPFLPTVNAPSVSRKNPYSDIANGPDAMKFVKASYDWLELSDPYYTVRARLWSKEVNDSPCPEGWSIPSEAELRILYNKYKRYANTRAEFMGDEPNELLYIPYFGYLDYDGKYVDRGEFYAWSNKESSPGKVPLLYLTTTIGLHAGHSVGCGFSVRCVQLITSANP